jgi:hypothetical protein
MHYERAPRFSKVEAGCGGAASAALRCAGASLRCGGARGWSGVVGPAKKSKQESPVLESSTPGLMRRGLETNLRFGS